MTEAAPANEMSREEKRRQGLAAFAAAHRIAELGTVWVNPLTGKRNRFKPLDVLLVDRIQRERYENGSLLTAERRTSLGIQQHMNQGMARWE